MARSLARLADPPAPGPVVVHRSRGQGPQLAGELLDSRLEGPGTPVAHQHDHRGDDAGGHGDAEVEEVDHASSSTSTTGRDPVAQSAPSDHSSRFQIGTVALTASMQ